MDVCRALSVGKGKTNKTKVFLSKTSSIPRTGEGSSP
jgi:hypothetical protein